MGYFKQAYDMSHGVDGFDAFFFGFTILMSPIALPVYWLGVIGQKTIENINND